MVDCYKTREDAGYDLDTREISYDEKFLDDLRAGVVDRFDVETDAQAESFEIYAHEVLDEVPYRIRELQREIERLNGELHAEMEILDKFPQEVREILPNFEHR